MNIFHWTIILSRLFSFVVSPIDADRFREGFTIKSRQRESFMEEDITKQLEQLEPKIDWSKCLRWRDLRRAIKRYHMVGDEFLFWLAIQALALAYMVFKVSLYSLYVRSDLELANYLDEFYCFPQLFASYTNGRELSSHCLAIILYSCLNRLIAIYKLVKNALINFDYQRDFTTSQINFCHLTPYNWTPSQWFKLLKRCFTHRLDCKSNKRLLELHLKKDSKLLEKFIESSSRDIIYRTNLIDFTACYEEINFLPTPGAIDKSFRGWHLVLPMQRVDPFEFGLMASTYILFLVGLITIIVFVLSAATILELNQTVVPEHSHASLLEILPYIPQYLAEPKRLIRLLDAWLFVFIQIPNQLDSGTFYWNAGITLSRARKVTECFKLDLEKISHRRETIDKETRCDGRESSSGRLTDANLVISNSRIKRDHRLAPICPAHVIHKLSTEELQTNASILQNIKLTQLVGAEFNDIKRVHSLYLNIMMIGGGCCLAFSISTLQYSIGSVLQFATIFTSILGASLPVIAVFIHSIFVDRQVSSRYLHSKGL